MMNKQCEPKSTAVWCKHCSQMQFPEDHLDLYNERCITCGARLTHTIPEPVPIDPYADWKSAYAETINDMVTHIYNTGGK